MVGVCPFSECGVGERELLRLMVLTGFGAEGARTTRKKRMEGIGIDR